MRDSRLGLLGWTLGHVGTVLLYLPFYPSIGSNANMQAFFTDFPSEVVTIFGLDQLGSGAAYTQATYFGLVAFLLMAIAAISWGAAAIAGDEESGQLELTMAHGVGRAQVVLERALALVTKVAVVVVLASLAVWLLNDYAELELTATNVVAVSVALVGLSVTVGMAALAAGAVSGRRTVATTVGAGVAVMGYVLDAVSQTAHLPWLASFSPYHWAFGASPIVNGFDGAGLSLLAAAAAVFLVVAAAGFVRRDVGTG
jgi:ABC-2 type transport system permease protein